MRKFYAKLQLEFTSEVVSKSQAPITEKLAWPGTRFSKAPETFRAHKAIFSYGKFADFWSELCWN